MYDMFANRNLLKKKIEDAANCEEEDAPQEEQNEKLQLESPVTLKEPETPKPEDAPQPVKKLAQKDFKKITFVEPKGPPLPPKEMIQSKMDQVLIDSRELDFIKKQKEQL